MKHAYLLYTGYGKTKLMLDTIMGMPVRPRVLLISTKNIVEFSWQSEIDKWYPGQLSYTFITGKVPIKDRKKLLEHPCDILALNTDMIKWYIENTTKKPSELITRFNMVIIDESSLFKNYSSKRFKLLKTWCSKCEHVFILSATPTPKSIEDLWSQIYLLDGGQRLGKNITKFRDDYAIPVPLHNGLTVYRYNQETVDYILTLVKDIVTSIPEPPAPLFPEPIIKKVMIDPDPETAKILKQFKEDYIIPQLNLIAFNKTELMIKIGQIASGQMYSDKTVVNINDRKFKALQYLLAQITTPVLIVYNYVFDKEKLLQLPGARLLDNNEAFLDWNANKIPIGILSPFSVAHGINLQMSDCENIIWFSPIWDTEKWQQTNARVCRRGQTRTVTIRVLFLKDTYDDYMFDLVQEKFRIQYNNLKKLQ